MNARLLACACIVLALVWLPWLRTEDPSIAQVGETAAVAEVRAAESRAALHAPLAAVREDSAEALEGDAVPAIAAEPAAVAPEAPADARLRRGKVLDAEGRGVAGAEVRAYTFPRPQTSARTDLEGSFELEVEPRYGIVIVTHADHPDAHFAVKPDDPWILTLPASRFLHVAVRDEAGTPLSGATVRCSHEVGWSEHETQADGRVSFRIPGEGRVSLTISKPDYQPVEQVARHSRGCEGRRLRYSSSP